MFWDKSFFVLKLYSEIKRFFLSVLYGLFLRIFVVKCYDWFVFTEKFCNYKFTNRAKSRQNGYILAAS